MLAFYLLQTASTINSNGTPMAPTAASVGIPWAALMFIIAIGMIWFLVIGMRRDVKDIKKRLEQPVPTKS
jgi:hypothetical protein